jgi:hypothetical protein
MAALIPPCLVYYGIVAFNVLSSPLPVNDDIGSSPAVLLLRTFCFLPVTMLFGLLIIRRVRGNIIGPLLIIIGASLAGGTQSVGRSALLQAIIQFANQSNIAFFFLLLFYFPSGKANIPRLERVILLFALAAPIQALLKLLATSHLNPSTTNSPNPLYVPVLTSVSDVPSGLFAVFLILVFVSTFSLFVRYRVADPHERQQIKWFVWCASTMIPIMLGWLAGFLIPGVFESLFGKILALVSSTWFYAIVPLGVGVSILRHRLYDIDIIIRRTLIYSVLTTILAVIYFGGVVVAQQVFRATTGEIPDIAIVLTTLLIATLFTPLRRRIQNTIDRRLYRRKYDVEQTLEKFNRTLRDEVNLEDLKASLVGVVNDTMQPAKVALWVRE